MDTTDVRGKKSPDLFRHRRFGLFLFFFFSPCLRALPPLPWCPRQFFVGSQPGATEPTPRDPPLPSWALPFKATSCACSTSVPCPCLSPIPWLHRRQMLNLECFCSRLVNERIRVLWITSSISTAIALFSSFDLT